MGKETYVTLLFILTVASLDRSDGSACQVDCKSPMNGTETKQFCDKYSFTLRDRCCYNVTLSDETVVGVDLHDCSLANITGLFENLTSLVIISLEGNPLTEVKPQEFYQLTSLQYLSLPEQAPKASIQCPGGENAWTSITVISKDTIICQHQLNTCQNIENNGTCPSPQSTCTPAGPGFVDCHCSPGYHGYKCLRTGTFPTAAFAGGLGASTIVLSAVLWITQRRHVKKRD